MRHKIVEGLPTTVKAQTDGFFKGIWEIVFQREKIKESIEGNIGKEGGFWRLFL